MFIFFVFCSLVKYLINSVLSRAETGAVKCRLRCLRAPSNRATIPAHKSWLGLDFVTKRNHLSKRERTDYIEPMVILSILYFSYLGRLPTLLFAIKSFLLIDPPPLGWCSCDGPPACLMMVMLPVMYWPTCCGANGSFMNVRVWIFSTWKALGFLLNFLNFCQFP